MSGIIEAFNSSNDVIINAKAGTGKTTTLKKLAKMVPNSSILYLVYNRKNQEEAKNEFPKNTTVMTTNSFCGSIVYKTFKAKLNKFKPFKVIPKH